MRSPCFCDHSESEINIVLQDQESGRKGGFEMREEKTTGNHENKLKPIKTNYCIHPPFIVFNPHDMQKKQVDFHQGPALMPVPGLSMKEDMWIQELYLLQVWCQAHKINQQSYKCVCNLQ
jgi:hypothetical protein